MSGGASARNGGRPALSPHTDDSGLEPWLQRPSRRGRRSHPEIPPPPLYAAQRLPDNQASEEREIFWPAGAEPVARFAGYDVLGRIATGGAVNTYLALEHLAAGKVRHIALQVAAPSAVADTKAFVRDGEAWRSLSHPHLARVHDVGLWRGQPFVASEWVRGTSLHDLLFGTDRPEVPLPVSFALRLAANVADGLEAIRGHGGDDATTALYHGRLSAHDIIIEPSGNARLVGCGIGQLFPYAPQSGPYRSPEACADMEIDSRADVFCLGVCLHEALTRKPLFLRETDGQNREAILVAEADLVHLPGHDFDGGLHATMPLALAKRPELRFQTPAELQFALERHLLDMGAVVLKQHMADWLSEHVREGTPRLGIHASDLAELEPARPAVVAGLPARTDAASGVVVRRPTRSRLEVPWWGYALALALAGLVAAWVAIERRDARVEAERRDARVEAERRDARVEAERRDALVEPAAPPTSAATR